MVVMLPDLGVHSPHPGQLGLHARATCWPGITRGKKQSGFAHMTEICAARLVELLRFFEPSLIVSVFNCAWVVNKQQMVRLLTLISSSCIFLATSKSLSSWSVRSSFFSPLVASSSPYSDCDTTAPLPRWTIRPAGVEKQIRVATEDT